MPMLISSIIDSPLRRALIEFRQTENVWWFAFETALYAVAVLVLVSLAKE